MLSVGSSIESFRTISCKRGLKWLIWPPKVQESQKRDIIYFTFEQKARKWLVG